MAGIQQLPEFPCGVLDALIGMEQEAVGGMAFGIGFLKGSIYQRRVGFAGKLPGNDFPGKQIHDNTEIVPSPAGFEIGNIADPYEVGAH